MNNPLPLAIICSKQLINIFANELLENLLYASLARFHSDAS